MSDRNIKVPDGMMVAAIDKLKSKPFADSLSVGLSGDSRWPGLNAILEAALRWQADNPIAPSDDMLIDLRDIGREVDERYNANQFTCAGCAAVVAEFQRRVYLNSCPKAPNIIQDLLYSGRSDSYITDTSDKTNERIIEAFRRGRGLGNQR